MSELRYAKIIDEATHEVQVGVGCLDEYYIEIGMVEMEVEQAYNGSWYVKGFAPERPEAEIIAQQVAELKAELSSTDYKAIKFAEGWISEEDYAPIKAKRQELRDKINELENRE